jgi:anaerobic selenocysteine-containing dehydrogenase
MGNLKMTRHVCPRNCYGACSFIAYTNNGILEKLEGDPSNTYTQGKFCAKGYNFINYVYHPDRIKYPLIQTKRGSGDWKRISWEYALEIISTKILELNKRYQSNLSICLNKYSGNLGILHRSVENFFDSLGNTTRVIGSPCWSAGFDAQYYDFGNYETSDPSDMENAKLIILWGVNPAWTAVHALPYIFNAQDNGAKVVVIDPIFTVSAKKADYYIQIKPGSDGALALAIAKVLIENNQYDHAFISNNTLGWEKFKSYVLSLSLKELSNDTGIHIDTIYQLANMIGNIHPMFTWVGFGLQRHSNGGQNIRAINALHALTGNIGIPGGGVNFGHEMTQKFTSCNRSHDNQNRLIEVNRFSDSLSILTDPPINFLWISCRNILNQDPQTQNLKNALENIEFIVTVDQFLTPTALQSDIVLPTTNFFEEEDIIAGYWHHFIGYNQKAIEPYYESKSDLEISKLLSKALNQKSPGFCKFPEERSISHFIEREFNEEIYELLGIKHWSELKNGVKKAKLSKTSWSDFNFKTPSGKFEFLSERAFKNGYPSIAEYRKSMTPSEKYPYWLLTTHSQYRLNSQFSNSSYLVNVEKEPIFYLHPLTAKVHGIANRNKIKVFNDLGEIEAIAEFTDDLPKDIILLYQGWYEETKIIINRIIPGYSTDMGEISTGAKSIAFYDTFVNLTKL